MFRIWAKKEKKKKRGTKTARPPTPTASAQHLTSCRDIILRKIPGVKYVCVGKEHSFGKRRPKYRTSIKNFMVSNRPVQRRHLLKIVGFYPVDAQADLDRAKAEENKDDEVILTFLMAGVQVPGGAQAGQHHLAAHQQVNCFGANFSEDVTSEARTYKALEWQTGRKEMARNRDSYKWRKLTRHSPIFICMQYSIFNTFPPCIIQSNNCQNAAHSLRLFALPEHTTISYAFYICLFKFYICKSLLRSSFIMHSKGKSSTIIQ
ncbi:uncharacterized protein LOC130924002 [Corythoichthys intestinalis]|uniref:uncharacterized protein LOC130924002 n=1 Tax=Corythoichthys intestinalis TaxID=161448 RepID=UPI0025A4CEA6|nr:uncharacterized protein LOC130924002 [Corythoichthys intestinalis]